MKQFVRICNFSFCTSSLPLAILKVLSLQPSVLTSHQFLPCISQSDQVAQGFIQSHPEKPPRMECTMSVGSQLHCLVWYHVVFSMLWYFLFAGLALQTKRTKAPYKITNECPQEKSRAVNLLYVSRLGSDLTGV